MEELINLAMNSQVKSLPNLGMVCHVKRLTSSDVDSLVERKIQAEGLST